MKLTAATLRASRKTDLKVRIPEYMKVNIDGKPVKIAPDTDGTTTFSLIPGQNLNLTI